MSKDEPAVEEAAAELVENHLRTTGTAELGDVEDADEIASRLMGTVPTRTRPPAQEELLVAAPEVATTRPQPRVTWGKKEEDERETQRIFGALTK